MQAKKYSRITYPHVGVLDVFSEFWRSIRKQKFLMWLMVAGIIFGNVMEIIAPLYYKKFFDFLAEAAPVRENTDRLVFLIAIILAIHFLAWIGWRVCSFACNIFQPNVIADLKREAYDKLIRHSYRFFASNFTGALVQRVNRYARAFEHIADRITWNILPLATKITGVIIVLSSVNHKVTWIIVGYLVILIIFNYFFSRWKLKYDVALAECDSRTTAVLADTITNHNNIQLFAGYEFEKKNFFGATEKQRKLTSWTWHLNSWTDALQALFIVIVEFILFYFSVQYWQQGVFTLGHFVLIQAYVLTLGHSFWDFARIIRDSYEGYADAKEMVEIIKLPREIKDAPDAKNLIVKNGAIEFKKLSFSFNSGYEVLRAVNLKITPGEKIALVGPSGAGKSTLVKLLLRLYELTSGIILIDGQNISAVRHENLMDSISFVPQDPILFHRSLFENIRYGRRNTSKAEVTRAGKLAHCDEFTESLRDGYETYVGERGIKLSGGERQRIAIARAILKNAPILVLDEATSSLDSHSESLIQDALNNLMKNKTTIVIAHRLSTIRKMDRVIVLEKGRIIEEGSHNDLTKKDKGLYKKLWDLQAGGFIQK